MARVNAFPRAHQRALTLLECVIAMGILLFACVIFGSAMIVATDAEEKAAAHTQAIMVGNYLMEYIRRDSFFWDTNTEWSGSGCSYPSNCWSTENPANTDKNGNPVTAYDDSLATLPASFHSGFQPPTAEGITLPAYHYIWRADPIDRSSFTAGQTGVALITIEIYINQDGPSDVYVLKGLNREL
jgi:type II secretory pathway pseudopilin PulG